MRASCVMVPCSAPEGIPYARTRKESPRRLPVSSQVDLCRSSTGTEAWPVDQGLWSTEADASDDSMPDDRTLSLPPWSRVSGMWRCNRCMYTAPDIYRIKRHQVTHTGERRYYCPICQARFTAKQSVKTHMRRHTGERPFACSRCPARFSRSQRLASHLQTCSAGAGFEQAA
ncbi:hypothetical protein MRX96_023575 [Rhipicephalus microplus]